MIGLQVNFLIDVFDLALGVSVGKATFDLGKKNTPWTSGKLLGGSSHLGYVVNNHGDPKSRKDRVVGPLPNGLFMAYKWG